DEYSENSYGDNYYPPKEPKKFTCADSGIVVDKKENCPLVCPAGTDLAGHLVKAGSNLQVVCDEDTAQFETCPAGTDLAGVLVTNEPEDCNIFATCDANDPLGQALGLAGAQTVEVADPQLCQLTIPDGMDLFTCPAGSNLGEGALVTHEDLCNAATPAEQCPAGSTLEGVWVLPTETATCNIPIPPPVPTVVCEPGTPLAGATVTDERLCQFEDISLFACSADSNLGAAVVTDQDLCNAATPAEQCPGGSDLAGVWVNPDELATTCSIQIPPAFVCPAGTPLAGATVTDERLCQFEDINLFTCPADSNLPNAQVTDPRLCDAATPAEQCPAGSTLEGVWVHPDELVICNIEIPPSFVCPAGSNLGAGAIVTDPQLCNAATPAVQCAPGTPLQGVWVHPSQTATCNILIPPSFTCPGGSNLPGAIVTDPRLCNAATPAVQCPAGSDLVGIWVHPAHIASCNISPADISISTNPDAQCLKCADLAIFAAANYNAASTTAGELRGTPATTPASNVFTICDDPDPRPAFNARIAGGAPPIGSINAIETAFDSCLDNAAVTPGTQAQTTALQANSLTTNVQPEAEIPTFSSMTTANAQPESETPTFSPMITGFSGLSP
ncbi:MAG TPA: hypothetical protein VF233_04865, partial [Nitrososphaeraceae archaeon]